jgi:hypothetical protein
MVRLSDGGGGEEGIDPSVLQSMIGTMKSSTGNAATVVDSYKSQFSRCGLDTSNLSSAAQDLSWAQSQLPMLSRRQSMAQAAANMDPGLTVTDIGAGSLDFPTDAAAQAAGKADGANALNALTDHSDDQFILKDLQAHRDDPAYMAAFFQALGPQGLTALGLQVSGYQQSDDTSQYQNWVSTVGEGFAVASYRMPYKQDWISQLQLPNNTMADPTMPQLSLVAPFLDQGVYSPTWLKPLGQYALYKAWAEAREPGMIPPPQLDGIWQALANNSAYDAQFYKDNWNAEEGPSIYGLITTPTAIGQEDSAFSAMISAATVPPQGNPLADAAPYEANAQLTVRDIGQTSASALNLSSDLKQAFGNITMNYFGGLASSVRAAAPGMGTQDMPGHVEATSDQWAGFLQVAMGDKTEAARLLTFYSAWRRSQPADWVNDPNAPLHQGLWNSASLGFMDDFIAANYQAAGAPAGDSGGQIAGVLAAGGAAFLTALVFPEGDAAVGLGALISAAGSDAAKGAFEEAAKGTIEGTFPDGVEPDAGKGDVGDLTNAQTKLDWTIRQWENSGGLNSKGIASIPPQDISTLPTGMPTTSDVHTYQQQYGGTFFDDKTGHLMPLDQIEKDPKALAAYNAWLQDPIVMYDNGPAFLSTAAGQTFSGYSRAMNSGGGG